MFRKIKASNLPDSIIRKKASEPVNSELVSILNKSFEKFLKLGMQNVFNTLTITANLDTNSPLKVKEGAKIEYGFSLSTDSKIQFYYKVDMNFAKLGETFKTNNTTLEDLLDIGYGNSSSYNLVNDNIGEYLAEIITSAVSGVVVKISK